MSKSISVFYSRSEKWVLVLETETPDDHEMELSDDRKIASLPSRSHLSVFSEDILSKWLIAEKNGSRVSVFNSNRVEAA